MKFWNKLSIRSQLILLITALIIITQTISFALISLFDTKERHAIAVEQAQTMVRVLNSDMLESLLNPSANNFAELSFKLSGFQSVDAVILVNAQHEQIFIYGEDEYTEMLLNSTIQGYEPIYDKEHLFLKQTVMDNGHTFGYTLAVLDPEQYQTQVQERFTTLMWLFPIELLFALFIAWRLSLRYTEPFSQLAHVMQSNDVKNNTFTRISTQANNEIKQLFNGYNAMISQIERTTEEMRFQSTHDPLTGLLNRYGFENALELSLHRERHHENVLLKIDLDQFKLINDTASLSAGDAILKLIAHHLHQNLPEESVIARLDADNFAILITDCPPDESKTIAKNLLSSLKDFRFIWEDIPLTTSASGGLVNFISYEYTKAELMKLSDSSVAVAKSKGRNKLHIYHPNDQHNQLLRNKTTIVNQIKEALGNGPCQFELYAQTIEPLQTVSSQISYEILLRLRNGEGRIIPPDSFLPTAEQYNLMADIDSYVLWNFLEAVTQHPEHVEQLRSAHVNLAGSSLNHIDFQKTLKKAIETFDFPWHKLEMEVTETSAVSNLNQASDFIHFFRGVGIGFALDDFGTGMSSFDYLKKLPFDIIKIDGSFVKDMHNDPVDHAVIRYIQEISALKNQETVAEYIETEADLLALKEIGITYGQGYYLGKPKPLSDWISPENECIKPLTKTTPTT